MPHTLGEWQQELVFKPQLCHLHGPMSNIIYKKISSTEKERKILKNKTCMISISGLLNMKSLGLKFFAFHSWQITGTVH